MTDTTVVPPAPPAPPPAPPPAAWHTGLDAEIIGHAQNKGWKLDDPKEAFLGAVKQARELERHFGVPPEQLLKMPKADAKPEEIKAFWAKLGAGGEAKDYDLSAIKDAAGQPISAPLADAIRAAALEAYLPKDAATKVAARVVKHLDDAKAADAAVEAGKLAEEKARLAASWGVNKDFNHLKAMEGARRLGITPEAVKALEGQIGYFGVMEAMRKIGAGTSEGTFVEGNGGGGGGNPTTREGAVARKAELMADKAWTARFLAGGVAEGTEKRNLDIMIDGAA